MDQPIEITFLNVDRSQLLEEYVRRRVARLRRRYVRLAGCRVEIASPAPGGHTFAVALAVAVPGDTLELGVGPRQHEHQGDPFGVVRAAFEAAEESLAHRVELLPR